MVTMGDQTVVPKRCMTGLSYHCGSTWCHLTPKTLNVGARLSSYSPMSTNDDRPHDRRDWRRAMIVVPCVWDGQIALKRKRLATTFWSCQNPPHLDLYFTRNLSSLPCSPSHSSAAPIHIKTWREIPTGTLWRHVTIGLHLLGRSPSNQRHGHLLARPHLPVLPPRRPSP